MTVLAVIFWVSAALIVYAQLGYALLLLLLVRVMPRPGARRGAGALAAAQATSVSVIVAAYREERVIAARVKNLRHVSHRPLEIIVAVDGGADPDADATAACARGAGADRVLELPRGGKVAAQNAAVRVAQGEFLAFSDANAHWAPDAVERLLEAFADPVVGYACGSVRFTRPDGGTNQEGLYWRYEMAIRRLESRLSSITAGNGAIYMTRRGSYLELPPMMGHDIAFPFNMVKRGWRAVYVPAAQATEKMAPSIEGEFARKRRMARTETWPTVLRGGLLSPVGYSPLYALMIFSHRVLRYASPFLHLLALVSNLGLVIAHPSGLLYVILAAMQIALFALALSAAARPNRLALIARYYVWTTASLAAGLWDWLAGARGVGWDPLEATR